MQARRFFLDTQNRTFVAGADRNFTASAPAFFNEDVEGIELYFLEPTGEPTQPFRFLDYSANTVKLAVGITAPAALQTTWTGLSTAITASVTSLVNGGSSANEVQKISFSGRIPSDGGFILTLPERQPAQSVLLLNDDFLYIPNHGFLNGQLITIENIETGTTTFDDAQWYVVDRGGDVFRVSRTLNGPALENITSVGGQATLRAITTPQIPFNATAQQVQQAFIDAGISDGGVPQIIVTGSFSSGFTCVYTNALSNINFNNLTVFSNLFAAPALAANLSFNTNEVAALIAAGTTSNLRMEVEVSGGGRTQTYATAAAISPDIIDSTSPVPIPEGGTTGVLNFTDGSGGTWALSVDANGVVTTTKL